ncbi:lactate utilization protein B/C [Ginsengibacter hankyongi]|uniref:Lactate utilization protein B/C n=1 Tax=Ginsengibacter hankyongi TaxID=2607284 RepID=A0A5J5IEL4_9BACT|nr:LUD domain-containing protein [Ginsengibacter hankyongi]KAA9034359.1 lactate utilization protein B/C [Ginsengibacter hankyongi]
MNSREKILAAIAINKPAFQPMPDVVVDIKYDYSVLVPQFLNILQINGATAVWVENVQTIKDDLQKNIAGGHYTINTTEVLGIVNEEININSNPAFLDPVEIAYISGTLGIAENGAIWLEESKMRNRLLPFICQHLVIVLDVTKIVADMHEAYKRITLGNEGYGVFVAGPSKTADIEQSLVVGAHGARSLKVYLLS